MYWQYRHRRISTTIFLSGIRVITVEALQSEKTFVNMVYHSWVLGLGLSIKLLLSTITSYYSVTFIPCQEPPTAGWHTVSLGLHIISFNPFNLSDWEINRYCMTKTACQCQIIRRIQILQVVFRWGTHTIIRLSLRLPNLKCHLIKHINATALFSTIKKLNATERFNCCQSACPFEDLWETVSRFPKPHFIVFFQFNSKWLYWRKSGSNRWCQLWRHLFVSSKHEDILWSENFQSID